MSSTARRDRLRTVAVRGIQARVSVRPASGRLVDAPPLLLCNGIGASLEALQPLVDALLPTLIHPVRELVCDGGATVKTVWRLFDGALVESVLMRYPDRATVCVSSQAGCGMNCPFCATGQAGLTRNMSAAEIVDQVVAGAKE